MRKFLLFSLLVSFTGVALAAGGSVHVLDIHGFTSGTAVSEGTDYSMVYLSQIFGTVGNVLQGSSGQMVGKLFGMFNKGVIVVTALWLLYSVVSFFIKAGLEGTWQPQQGPKIAPLFLRIAFGFALLIPSPATGYNLLQDIFMEVVVQGVGLADTIWDTALDYIQDGGTLYIPPSGLSSLSMPNILKSALGTNYQSNTFSYNNLGPLAAVFMDEVCMLRSSFFVNQYLKSLGFKKRQLFQNNFQMSFSPVYDKKTRTIYFPGMGDKVGMTVKDYQTQGAACGYITGIAPTVTGTSAQKQQENKAQKAASWSAVTEVVQGMMPAAQSVVNFVGEYGNSLPAVVAKIMKATTNKNANGIIPPSLLNIFLQINHATFNTILGYANLIMPFQRVATSGDMASSSDLQFIQFAKTDGWLTAGDFYWAIAQANKKAKSVSVSNLFPKEFNKGYPKAPYINKSYKDGFLQATRVLMLLSKAAITGVKEVPGSVGMWNTYTYAQGMASGNASAEKQAMAPASYSASPWLVDIFNALPKKEMAGGGALMKESQTIQTSYSPSTRSNIADDVLRYFFGALAQTVQQIVEFARTGNVMAIYGGRGHNPAAVLMSVGQQLMNTVLEAWISVITASFLIGMAAGICMSTQPAADGFQAVLGWLKGIAMMITALVLGPAIIMAYYVPLYPYFVYAFAVLGWIAVVIEGMAAAPLVCMGLTHPEGHDFLGKAEQTLMLFLSIFLRPGLMVIGLIAGMLVSYVAFGMVVAGFGMVFKYTIASSGEASGITWLFGAASILLIFGMMIYEIVQKSYALIYKLPNNIMKWIGVSDATAQDDIGSSVQALQGAAQKGADMTTSATQKVGGFAQGAAVKVGYAVGEAIKEE